MAEPILPTPLPRNIFFSKQVDQVSIEAVQRALLAINENDDYLKKLYAIHNITYVPQPMKIYIDSYGGVVYQILGLISMIEASKTPVHTIVTGCAMSCGFMLLISGHKRFAYPRATPLYHQVSSGTRGTLKEQEESLEETKRLQKMIEEITISKTNISKKKLKEVYNGKVDWYMTAEEALKLGVVDEIIT